LEAHLSPTSAWELTALSRPAALTRRAGADEGRYMVREFGMDWEKGKTKR